MIAENIFDGIAPDLGEELFTEILRGGSFRLLRIVSQGQASPEGFWYDQNQREWVIVLQGRAGILFAGETAPVELSPGSYLDIPAHTKHRVQWTDPQQTTVWLAIHY